MLNLHDINKQFSSSIFHGEVLPFVNCTSNLSSESPSLEAAARDLSGVRKPPIVEAIRGCRADQKGSPAITVGGPKRSAQRGDRHFGTRAWNRPLRSYYSFHRVSRPGPWRVRTSDSRGLTRPFWAAPHALPLCPTDPLPPPTPRKPACSSRIWTSCRSSGPAAGRYPP